MNGGGKLTNFCVKTGEWRPLRRHGRRWLKSADFRPRTPRVRILAKFEPAKWACATWPISRLLTDRSPAGATDSSVAELDPLSGCSSVVHRQHHDRVSNLGLPVIDAVRKLLHRGVVQPNCKRAEAYHSSCRLRIVLSTKWKDAVNSLTASTSRLDAWSGIWERSRHGWNSAVGHTRKALLRSRLAPTAGGAVPGRLSSDRSDRLTPSAMGPIATCRL